MGCFDTVTFRCPDCGGRADIQSKAGDCTLSEYSEHCVPLAIAADVDGEVVVCGDCQRSYRIMGPGGTVQLRLQGRW